MSNNEAAEPACRAVASSANLATAAMVAAQPQKIATTKQCPGNRRARRRRRARGCRADQQGRKRRRCRARRKASGPHRSRWRTAATLAVASMPGAFRDGDRIGDRRQRRAGRRPPTSRRRPATKAISTSRNCTSAVTVTPRMPPSNGGSTTAAPRRQALAGDRCPTSSRRSWRRSRAGRPASGKSADAAAIRPATAPSSRDPKRADRKSPGVALPLRRK